MTIPVSTVDAAKDFLVAQLAALSIVTTPPPSGSDPIVIQYDLIGKNVPTEYVEVGDEIEQQAQKHALVGSGQTGWLSETYRIKLTIHVWHGGDQPDVVWKRANAISQAIDTLIRTDPSCGGLVKVAYPAAFTSTSGWDPEGKGRKVVIERWIEFFTVI